jgi:hypothetical protein
MKFASVSKTLLMGFALLLASSAFAASKADLILQHPTSINGTQLKAGEYKLEWEGTGPNVELSIKQGRKVLAKVPAKLVDLPVAPDNDAAVVKMGEDGSRNLAGARFAGKKFAIDLQESNDGIQAGSSK